MELKEMLEHELDTIGRSWGAAEHMQGHVKGVVRYASNLAMMRAGMRMADAELWAIECIEKASGMTLPWLRNFFIGSVAD